MKKYEKTFEIFLIYYLKIIYGFMNEDYKKFF